MYGFKITVIVGAGEPDSLSSKLDDITDELALLAHSEDKFKGYMIMEHVPGEVTFLITADAESEVEALTLAISWLHCSVHAAGFATPGWLRSAEQVFDEVPA